jgi:hypothetical protein
LINFNGIESPTTRPISKLILHHALFPTLG